MLCPQCGTDVGESVRLCEKCEADRQARLEAKRKAEEEEARNKSSSRWSRQSAQTVDATSEKSGERLTTAAIDAEAESTFQEQQHPRSAAKRTLLLVVCMLLVLAGVKAYKSRAMLFGSVPPPPPPTTSPSPGTNSGAAAEPESYLSSAKAGIKLDRSEVRLPTAVAVYHRGNRRLEVLFFRSWEGTLDDSLLRKPETPEKVQGVRPDAILSLTFQPDFRSCSLASLSEYSITVFRNSGGLEAPSDKITFPVRRAIDGGRTAVGINSAIETLGCEFKDGGKVNGSFRGTKQVAVRDESKPLSWDFEFEAVLIAPKAVGELSYATAQSQETMALWDGGKNELSVGFFGDPLSPEDKAAIRSDGSFDGTFPKKPDVALTFTMVPGAKELSSEKLKTYGVVYYREQKAGFEFPGDDDRFGAFFVKSDQPPGLKDLSGPLSDGAEVSGSFAGETKKSTIGVDVRMKWDLAFKTPVFDVAGRGVPAAITEKKEPEAVTSDEKGVVKAGDVEVRGVSAVALFYPDASELALGVYSDRLDQSEIAEIAKRKTVSTYVNLKRPTMAIQLTLEANGISYDLKGYTVYFYREAGASFQFPGFHDVASFKRQKSELPPNEVAFFSGNPASGEPVTIRMKGEGTAPNVPTPFSWDLEYRIRPVTVK